MNTAEFCQSNILVIPDALAGMEDIRCICRYQDAQIFYKQLADDLVNVEFYTNTPCLIYIQSGRETLTNSDNRTTNLQAGSAIFLPRGINLHSDYVKETEDLKAYLVFFSDTIIRKFLSQSKPSQASLPSQDSLILPNVPELETFFTSFQKDIDNPAYVQLKLQELLHLIEWKDGSGTLASLLSASNTDSPKRNLHRLLDNQDVLKLKVADLANLSGRSLSTFNRDFKMAYGTTPQKWLRDKRLSLAKTLLETQRLSVTDVAMDVGYLNVSNFIKAFKKRYGITPKQIDSEQ
ncbi:putative AraC-type DNA-binding domain-containing protein [Vibrio nigripulchritudo SOn1]|uniref:AraC-type DNA-binding domain-containing protein n=1 Tax=Vibrio nigripulchritudo SOn1 TaxID=1238450 RepID=A0AAV2VPB2_9VIBR|nr:AraC family transcriptional regulator [Vibrio nigripulchritudo]CCO46385.1 putative AraC-type DNA-binding domain-containing protein [Vibrio nigripulchritudo SOn1]